MSVTDWYNEINIGGVILTDNNVAGATPCISSLNGLAALDLNRSFKTVIALDGTAHTQKLNTAKGQEIEINIPLLNVADKNALIPILQNAIDADGTIDITASGEAGDFTFAAKVREPGIEYGGDFLTGKIKNVKLFFVAQSQDFSVSSSSGSVSLTGTAATLTYSGA